MMEALRTVFTYQLVHAAIRCSIPLMYACMACIICRQANVFNMSVEGVMLFSCFIAAAVSYKTSNWVIAVLVSIIFGMLVSGFLALSSMKLKGNIVIMAIVTVIMAVVLSLYIKNTGTVPAADNTASLADGTYTASEQGCLSEVAVTVTVTGGKVTNVAIDASGETPELGGAAAETLADELTKAGSTAGVDAVSGATLTSNAVFTAMDSCLAQAGTGSAGAEDLTDGTYTSSAKGCLSDVNVTVTVSGGKVSEVAIDASGETPELGGAAAETLADALTKAGSTNGVDAVSGATMTSEAVFTAMNDCLSQAQ